MTNSFNIKPNYKFISGSALKWIAIITMLIDHIGAALICALPGYILDHSAPIFPGCPISYYNLYRIFRQIGRTAFPIFCFLLVEGFFHTSSRKKYAFRLFLFALVSEIPFDLAIQNKISITNSQNVFFTLFLGLIAMMMIDAVKNHFESRGHSQSVNLPVLFIIIILFLLLADFLKTDYSSSGVTLIIIFYLLRANTISACIVGYISFLFEPFCFPAFLIIPFYNQKRGHMHIGPFSLKYFFYIFYPSHLLVLYALRYFLLSGQTP